MTPQRRRLLLSIMLIMLSVSIIAGGTYALFSDQVTLTNHLQAGTLDITLTRTNLKTKTLDPDTGFLVENENTKHIDFSKPADPNDPNAENKNVFDMVEGDLIVPGCKYSAEMQISNNSDVAFGYWLKIVFDDTVDLTLADQILITVTTADQSKSISKMLSASKGLIGAEDNPIEILAKTGSALFTVSNEFCDLDHSVNNNAKSKSFSFDLEVHAVQITNTPSD